MDDLLELIEIKIKKCKKLQILNILLGIGFTLAGTLSIMSLLMYFNSAFGLNIFYCFLLAILFPQTYSILVNALLLDKIDDQVNVLLKEIAKLEKEYELAMEPVTEIKNIELRLEGLSVKNRKKILNYIRDNVSSEVKIDNTMTSVDIMSFGNNEDMVDADLEQKSGYTRKRVKKDNDNNVN